MTRGGRHYRVAEREWKKPLDGRPGVASGGRWNSPGSFPVVYFNSTKALARRFVAHKLRGQPFGPELLDPRIGPVLVHANLPREPYVDIVTESGCKAAGLPRSYPRDSAGSVVAHEACWPVGQAAWDAGERGIAGRSATDGATLSDEELAWFQRNGALRAAEIEPFDKWFF
ncbi:MAG: RES domain-containing protein [Acidimicrobiia bacterium]